ncbi:MAG: EGF domain-containing protein, partial [Myxococcales bacterium]
TDVDECATGAHDRSLNATCTNTPGSFSCACNSGYTGNGVSCADVNECATGAHNCSPNAICSNSPGSFSCACRPGYAGNGVSCTDVDECATGAHNCSPDATCTNTGGSFSCACNSGYSGNGVTCTDDDECADGTANCAAEATCTNTPGGFSCRCPPTMTGDGFSCSHHPSCMAISAAVQNASDGTYTIDPGTGPIEVHCDMTLNGGGWTLLGSMVNLDGARNWNSLASLTSASTFGQLATRRAADFKSPAWAQVKGADLLLRTGGYHLGFNALLGNRTLPEHITAFWPQSCNTTWIRSGADFGAGLTVQQLRTFGYTYRGLDTNATCFPSTNENAAISLLAMPNWVDGLANTPAGYPTWSDHDHSMMLPGRIVPVACSGGWPCNGNGLMQDQGAQCYDPSCKENWVEVYVR